MRPRKFWPAILYMASCFLIGEDMFDSNGRLVVDETLQLVGRSGAYAIGDCCGTPETKMGAHAAKHGTTVADNLIRELKGQEKTSYKQVKTHCFLWLSET